MFFWTQVSVFFSAAVEFTEFRFMLYFYVCEKFCSDPVSSPQLELLQRSLSLFLLLQRTVSPTKLHCLGFNEVSDLITESVHFSAQT